MSPAVTFKIFVYCLHIVLIGCVSRGSRAESDYVTLFKAQLQC